MYMYSVNKVSYEYPLVHAESGPPSLVRIIIGNVSIYLVSFPDVEMTCVAYQIHNSGVHHIYKNHTVK